MNSKGTKIKKVVVLGLLIWASFAYGQNRDLEQFLIGYAEEANKDLPAAFGNGVRADKASAAGHYLTYEFTYLNVLERETYLAPLKKVLFDSTKAGVCSSQYDTLLQAGAIIRMKYLDKEGSSLATLTYTKDVCGAVDDDLNVTHGSSQFKDPIPFALFLDGLKRGNPINNEEGNPGLGLTIPYNGLGVKATVYIYNLGISTIPDGPESPVSRSAFESAIEEIMDAKSLGLYEQFKQEGGKYYSGTPSRGVEFICADFDVVQKGNRMDSMVCLTGYQNHFVKIRISKQGGAFNDFNLREFVDSIGLILWADS